MKRKNSPWFYIKFFLMNLAVYMIFHTENVMGNEMVDCGCYNENKIETIGGDFFELLEVENFQDFQKETVSGRLVEEIKNISGNYFVLSDEQCEKQKKLMMRHLREGQKCFREAEDLCVFIPDADDYKKAEELFKTASIIAIGQMKFSAVIIALLVNLQEYGISTYRKWRQMQTLLKECEYNFEMYEHYQEVFTKGGCQ